MINCETYIPAGSRKLSRVGSSTASPLRVPSPTTTAATTEDDAIFKSTSIPTRKITLDLVPRSAEKPVRLEDSVGVQEITEIDRVEEQMEEKLSKWASKSMWHHFVYYMIPVDIETWSETSWLSKFLQVLQTPIFMIFRITIPTVLEELLDESVENEVVIIKDERKDVSRTMRPVAEEPEPEYENEPIPNEQSVVSEGQESTELDFEAMHGWCKPLNVLQCVIVPTLWPLLLTCEFLHIFPINQLNIYSGMT